jgi:hypothetical protein
MTINQNAHLPQPFGLTGDCVLRADKAWLHRHDIDLTCVRETGRRAGAKIGACAVIVSLICVSAYIGQQYLAVTPSDTKERMPIETRELPSSPNRLQAVIDATPALRVAIAARPDRPATVVPLKRPAFKASYATVRENDKTDADGATAPGVLRFDRCNLRCETQDPLIVGSTSAGRHQDEAPLVARNEDHSSFGLSPLQGAGFILRRAADVPEAAIRTGRRMLGKIVGLE